MPTDWIEEIISTAKQTITAGYTFQATFYLKYKYSIKVISLGELPNKDIWSDFMRAAIAVTRPTEYLFISESWMKEFDAKQKSKDSDLNQIVKGHKQVSEYPDKKEILLLTHGIRSAGEKTGMIRISRQGLTVEFSQLEWFPTSIEGRLANLLNPL